MNGPRLTEERLRNYLNTRQPDREHMCAALLPVFGAYSDIRPRRPQGGPDGGRDIECLFDSRLITWGAVGFRNGGGNDSEARDDAIDKFKKDLASAMKKNDELPGFVFFTNVDLTPGQHEDLLSAARSEGVQHVEVFDFERLRQALDSPEGLLARLQYLEIPMSPTEQMALVTKYGSELQSIVANRFARVESTLDAMQAFLDTQKPLQRIDVLVGIDDLPEAFPKDDRVFGVTILPFPTLSMAFSIKTEFEDHAIEDGRNGVLTESRYFSINPNIFNQNTDGSVNIDAKIARSFSYDSNLLAAHFEVPFQTIAGRVKTADFTKLQFVLVARDSLIPYLQTLAVDFDGYEMINCNVSPDAVNESGQLRGIGEMIQQQSEGFSLAVLQEMNYAFSPPRRSGRWKPLIEMHSP